MRRLVGGVLVAFTCILPSLSYAQLAQQNPPAPQPEHPQGFTWTPQEMIAAYIDWLNKNPKANWDDAPAVHFVITRNHPYTNLPKVLNLETGTVDYADGQLHVEGKTLVGSGIKFLSNKHNFQSDKEPGSIVLDAADGSVSLNGQQKVGLRIMNGVLVASEATTPSDESTPSGEVLAIILSTSPGVKPH